MRSALDEAQRRDQSGFGEDAERALLIRLKVRRSAQKDGNHAVATGVPSNAASVAVDDHGRLL
jgi:hypothetical protein